VHDIQVIVIGVALLSPFNFALDFFGMMGSRSHFCPILTAAPQAH
jgi:hypothetical protein